MFGLILLFSLISYSIASEVANAATARAVTYGQVGLNGDCYLVSAEYQTRPSGASGDIFAAAMGKNIGLLGFPWTALGFVRGNVDLDRYANGSLDQVNADASGAVVAWAFVAIGEFCDTNNQEGFQVGSSDYIINYFLAPLGFPYTQNCGVEADPITGLNSYFSSIQSSLSNFNTTCRIFPTDTTVLRNGRKISKYQFKCDVRVDYTGLWSTNVTQINSCPDNRRKIGLLVNIAGSAFDVDVSVDSSLNTRTGNIPDADRISFAAGKLEFAWDNYVVNTPNFAATTGGFGRVTYGYIGDGQSSASYRGATVVKQVIFSFSTPKSDNKNFFYWDPVITADARSIVPFFGILFMICLNVLLL